MAFDDELLCERGEIHRRHFWMSRDPDPRAVQWQPYACPGRTTPSAAAIARDEAVEVFARIVSLPSGQAFRSAWQLWEAGRKFGQEEGKPDA